MKTHGTECKIRGKGQKIRLRRSSLEQDILMNLQPHISVMSRVKLPPGGSKEARELPFPSGIDSLANSAPKDKHFENEEEISF